MQTKTKTEKTKTMSENSPHQPVLLDEVIACLSPKEGESYLDVTAGYGGHASAVIQQTKALRRAVLVDRDAEAVDYLGSLHNLRGAKLVRDDFAHACDDLIKAGEKFDIILADLGVSSLHFDDAERGFSINNSGPLDMRMDRQLEKDAAYIVNNESEAELVRILRGYGQEPKASTIAKQIMRSRPLRTTGQLADIVKSTYPGYSRMHPATRTFQALRIAVNDELGQLERTLPLVANLLTPGGRLAIISFHSLEDRMVKHYFSEIAGHTLDAEYTPLTKRPITAGHDELINNPRARSAKLRACRKK